MVDRKSLEKKFTDAVQEQKIPDGFIKVTDNPVDGLNSEQKVILNRKANMMFNNGNIEDARRIYITEGMKALKAYYLAHNKRDAEPIYENLAKVISTLIQE